MKIEYILVKKENDFCNSVKRFNNLLQTNCRVIIEGSKIKFRNVTLEYNVTTENIINKKERMFHIVLISNQDDDKKDIENLDQFDKLLKRIIKESGIEFYLNTIWDEVSQYYCKKSYPIINEIENLMRKIIFRFMIKNLGIDWVRKSFPKKLKENLEKTAEKNKVEDLLENCLYEADFIQLIEFLFNPYSRENDINKVFQIIDEIKNIEELEKLKELQPKSNWERYFASIIKIDNLDEKWKKLYKYRNKIAHNKLITKEDYKNIINISNDIKEAFNKVLDNIDKVIVNESEKAIISEVSQESIQDFNFYKFNISSDLIRTIRSIQTIGSTFNDIQRANPIYKVLKDCNNVIDMYKFRNLSDFEESIEDHTESHIDQDENLNREEMDNSEDQNDDSNKTNEETKEEDNNEEQ